MYKVYRSTASFGHPFEKKYLKVVAYSFEHAIERAIRKEIKLHKELPIYHNANSEVYGDFAFVKVKNEKGLKKYYR